MKVRKGLQSTAVRLSTCVCVCLSPAGNTYVRHQQSLMLSRCSIAVVMKPELGFLSNAFPPRTDLTVKKLGERGKEEMLHFQTTYRAC